MIEVVSTETMRASDKWTIENLTSSKELMYRAGQGIFNAINFKSPVAIICGKGNNAGDGFVVAKLCKESNIDVFIYLLSDKFSEDGEYYFNQALDSGVEYKYYAPEDDLSPYSYIVDCLFGTGFKGSVSGLYEDVINKINNTNAFIVSADINSGLNGDTGKGELYVKSDLTVSIGHYKPGHFIGDANNAMKDKINVDIGIKIIGPILQLDI